MLACAPLAGQGAERPDTTATPAAVPTVNLDEVAVTAIKSGRANLATSPVAATIVGRDRKSVV